MSQYRIPFYGTILVDAKTQREAEVSAGTWARSMKQATHGVEMERPTTGRICALDLWTHQEPTDVTESFAGYRREYPVAPLDPELEEACRQNYHGEVQCAWELFERGERVKKSKVQEGTSASMDMPTTPLEAYKAIIDQLVNETRLSGPGSQVAERGIFSNAPAHQEYNAFIRSLSPEQRALLARMLSEARDGTIHDVLAALTWWMATKEVGFTFRGRSMPIELSGQGLHGDYIGRRDGWEWPK